MVQIMPEGGIQMKKTKKKEHKGRNNECLCKWTVFMHISHVVCLCSESSGAESVIHKCILNLMLITKCKKDEATVLISGSPHFNYRCLKVDLSIIKIV